MSIIGFSGSPIVDGNTDRLVKALLNGSEKEASFVNLSTLDFSPCRGCADLCGTTNLCGRKDELHPYLTKILEAEALVLGTPYQLGTATGFMFGFLTRLWCFMHVKNLLKNKPVMLVSVGIKERDQQNGIISFENMVTHSGQFNVLGHMYFDSQTPPCLICGAGSYCHVGGLWKYVLNKDEDKLKSFSFSEDKFKRWEDCPQMIDEIRQYSKVLSAL
jgi:multimeric flavodoxin WrbA